MTLSFINRKRELKEIDLLSKRGGLLVLFGRRRVGKTRLLIHWLEKRGGFKNRKFYSQAIEGVRELQISQLYSDLVSQLATSIVPKSWSEVFEIIELQKGPVTLCIDEFPYLVNSDSSLPSLLQRWLDHSKKKDLFVILAGSSTRMMHNLFLNRSAPLYGRAAKLLHVQQMSYNDFCNAVGLSAAQPDSFLKFSFVGGVPKYWEFVSKGQGALESAEDLYFNFAPYMQMEPRRVLKDEGLDDLNPLSILEAIGRGVNRPSEIAARMGTKQTNLSRVLQLLLDNEIIQREIPFGDSEKSGKRGIYTIGDPALRFWYRVFSPHQSQWRQFSDSQKIRHLGEHASTVFEDYCRKLFPGAKRYWEKDLEFDIVRYEDISRSKTSVVVSEVKWRRCSKSEQASILRELQNKWKRSQLAKRFKEVRFEVLDQKALT